MLFMTLSIEIAQTLCAINSDFYRRQSDSFSATRQAPWNGWKRCLGMIREACWGADDVASGEGLVEGVDGGPHLSVLDVACGNLRFEEFLASALPETAFDFYAVDNCDDLASNGLAEFDRLPANDFMEQSDGRLTADPVAESRTSAHYQSLDIVGVLLEGSQLGEALEAPACDLAVSFGFMHHVPLREQREDVLTALVRKTRPGGLVIVSFWQFMGNAALAARARATHARALEELGLPELDEGDYLLGWKNVPGAYRYCHSFPDAEIDQLVESVVGEAELVARFKADGKTDDLNAYAVLKVL